MQFYDPTEVSDQGRDEFYDSLSRLLRSGNRGHCNTNGRFNAQLDGVNSGLQGIEKMRTGSSLFAVFVGTKIGGTIFQYKRIHKVSPNIEKKFIDNIAINKKFRKCHLGVNKRSSQNYIH